MSFSVNPESFDFTYAQISCSRPCILLGYRNKFRCMVVIECCTCKAHNNIPLDHFFKDHY